jgi:CheY-like chemotaxis protein
VRHLVELHGGTVEAESEGEGRGATFRVKLPLLAVRREGSRERRPPRPAANARLPIDCTDRLGGLRVLVVDDERDARELLRFILESCGAEVAEAGSGGEAFELLESFSPDVLVSDIGMPGEDGYALIEKVRALAPERGGRVPAVALTAYTRPEDRLRVLRAGYQMHVSKPVEPAELIAIVDSLAGRTGKARGG